MILLVTTGCRIPKLLFTPPLTTIYYDTVYERELIGKTEPHPESLEYDFKWRYRDTLAEPVAMLDYQKDVYSKWNVLFATNRIPQGSSVAGEIHYANNYSEDLHYGRCAVGLTVPTQAELEQSRPSGFVGKLVNKLPQPWQQEIIFDEAKYSRVENVSELETQEFYRQLKQQIAASRQQDVLIFVHGFNVDFNASMSRLAQISRDLPFNGAVIAYSWPSQGGVENYDRDGSVVDDSIEPFMQFLEDLKAELPANVKVNLVVHSMGNRLVMRSIAKLPDVLEQESSPRFENIVLCAPDVGVEEFKRLARVVLPLSRRTTLYRCLNDTALIASSYKNGEERAGGSYAPVILDGLETIECAVIDTSILGHSYYGSNPHMLRDLFCVVKESRSAQERPWLKSKKIPFQGEYWIIGDWPVQLEWTWNFVQSASGVSQATFFSAPQQSLRPGEGASGKQLLSN